MFKWLRNTGIGCKIRPDNTGGRLVRIICFSDVLKVGILLLDRLSSRLIGGGIDDFYKSLSLAPCAAHRARFGFHPAAIGPGGPVELYAVGFPV